MKSNQEKFEEFSKPKYFVVDEDSKLVASFRTKASALHHIEQLNKSPPKLKFKVVESVTT